METLENMDEMLPEFLEKARREPGGFCLPDGYFDKMGDRFFETLQSGGQESAAHEAAFLEEIGPLGGGLSLPENYFEKLPGEVFSKIEADGFGQKLAESQPVLIGKQAEPTWNRPFFNIVKKPAALAAAASVAVLVAALAFFFKKETVETPGPMACNATCLSEKISAEDVQNYLSENLSEFSADELASEELVGDFSTAATKPHHEIEVSADEAEPLLREMLDDLSTEELEDML